MEAVEPHGLRSWQARMARVTCLASRRVESSAGKPLQTTTTTTTFPCHARNARESCPKPHKSRNETARRRAAPYHGSAMRACVRHVSTLKHATNYRYEAQGTLTPQKRARSARCTPQGGEQAGEARARREDTRQPADDN